MAVSMWDVWERAETGPIVPIKEFETRVLFRKTQELVKKYGIKYDPESVVPTDDGLIDKVWEAGVELLVHGHGEDHQVHRAGGSGHDPVCPEGGGAGGGQGRGRHGPQGHRG
jgi:hypothetical protein